MLRRTRALLIGVLLALASSTPAMAAAPQVEATLDGRPIDLDEVGRYQCHDLDYPVIRCFRKAVDRDLSIDLDLGVLDASVSVSVAASVVYVTLYDGQNLTGSSISLSQDYDALATIGWNDRASSFMGRNGETGRLYLDWFHGGSSTAFCCNQVFRTLSGYDNAYSSAYRT